MEWFSRGLRPDEHYLESAPPDFTVRKIGNATDVVAVRPRWVEWFSRGLRPGEHYLEAPSEPLEAICPAVVGTLTTAEQAFTTGTLTPKSVKTHSAQQRLQRDRRRRC